MLALDEDLDALVALDGVMEPLEMVIMHEKVWHQHNGGMMALGNYMIMIEIECNSVHDNGVLCDGIEVHVKNHIF